MSNVSLSISDQVRSAFDFTVDKFPLSGPENLPTDQYGLFRSDTGYIKGVTFLTLLMTCVHWWKLPKILSTAIYLSKRTGVKVIM